MSDLIRRLAFSLAIFATVNLLLLAILISWLMATGRMDAERFRRLREIIATPIDAERQALVLAANRARAEVELAEERARLALPPRTSAERTAAIDAEMDRIQMQRRMVEEEARLLSKSLQERASLLGEQEQRLEQREERLRAWLARESAERDDAQFRKTVQLLESAPPRQAKEWLIELASTGRREEAVRYLDAMSRFAASRMLRELKSAEETALGADLLDALRRRARDVSDSPP